MILRSRQTPSSRRVWSMALIIAFGLWRPGTFYFLDARWSKGSGLRSQSAGLQIEENGANKEPATVPRACRRGIKSAVSTAGHSTGPKTQRDDDVALCKELHVRDYRNAKKREHRRSARSHRLRVAMRHCPLDTLAMNRCRKQKLADGRIKTTGEAAAALCAMAPRPLSPVRVRGSKQVR